MNPDFPADSSRVDETAALWAAKLKGGVLKARDRDALQAWLARDPAHHWSLAQYQHLNAELDVGLSSLAAAGRIMSPATENRPRSNAWALGILAAGLAAFAVVFALRPAIQPSGPAFATRIAERQSVKLSDGSRADLNAQTRLAVEFRESERRVRMEQGEALFTVTKNPARPFVVETPGGRIRVTGTVFNVRTSAEGKLEVTVLEGTVEVQPPAATAVAAPLRLGVGDAVTLDHQDVALRRMTREAAVEAAAWRDGRVIFDDEPLAEALGHFAQFNGRTITVAPEVARQRVGGRYALDDLDGFLAGIERTMPVPVRVERLADGSIRLSAR
jgi:transmembrane sensor